MFFCPNIDGNLLLRFLKSLYPFETLLIALQTPVIFNMVKLKRLAITENIEIDCYRQYVVKIDQNSSYSYSRFSQIRVNLKNVIVKARVIHIKDKNIESKFFLSILFVYTKEIKCENVTVVPSLTFADMIMKTPNIEKIELNRTNIFMGSSWPEDLLKHKNGNNFKEMCATVNLDFNVEKFAEFMKVFNFKDFLFNRVSHFRQNVYQMSKLF